MDTKLKKKLIAAFFLLAFVICLLIGFLMESLYANKGDSSSEDAETKLFGLLNGEVVERFPVITAEDRKEEIAGRPAIDSSLENQIHTTVTRYLEKGSFEELDQYLSEIEESHRGSDQVNGLSLEDIQYMRADLSMILNMNSLSAKTMMQSFHNPEFLVAAMVYSPISCKYQGMLHLDSLIVPPPESSTPVVLLERTLSEDDVSLLLESMNQLNNQQIYDQIKLYTATVYGAELQYIIGHNLLNDSWSAYLIQCSDPRAYVAFHTSHAFQDMVNNGYIEENMLDRSFFPTQISDIPENGENNFSEQYVPEDGSSSTPILTGPVFDLHLNDVEEDTELPAQENS